MRWTNISFESDEAEYAQQQWTDWAGRYLAVLYSRVILPAELTPARFIQSPADLEQSNALGRRIALPPGRKCVFGPSWWP
ncbi:Uncharacterised protein [Salmonella enterica subsp. arizonae]|uniref:Uncharacterized protein n=1 Tax=Salmonella enterica subsp. arizonae TaxID=59203 RepID=A0A379T0B5_SALER|nr:Uncharacterised protein [Salmonella enterica subsp. arizonae]